MELHKSFFFSYKLVFCYQVAEKDEAASMKDWILRYAEQSSEEEEEEEEGEKRTLNPELEEKFDPVREKKQYKLYIIFARYKIKCVYFKAGVCSKLWKQVCNYSVWMNQMDVICSCEE